MMAKVILALVLVAIAAFSTFGFLASFEPPGFLGWRIVYGTVILTSLGSVVWMFARKSTA